MVSRQMRYEVGGAAKRPLKRLLAEVALCRRRVNKCEMSPDEAFRLRFSHNKYVDVD